MAHRSTLVTTLVGVLLSAGASATAQTIGATTGAVNGRVTDPTGAFLPGVVVVASGHAVMGTRPTATDARGSFELPALPPGDVTLMFSLPGFRTLIREGVRVNLGETVTVDAVLELPITEDSVVVSGRSPVIDRSGTAIAVSHDAQRLADLPGSRGINAILAATPGVQLTRFDVGGNAAVEPGQWSAYGVTAPGHPTIEGVSVQGHPQFGFTLDYGSFEHVAVKLAAFGPESPWPGVQIAAITKSGGARHHGSLYLDYENRHWQSFNIDDDQARRLPAGIGLPAREGNRLWGYHDANADAGGPLRKDSLWWYLSLRAQETSVKQVSFPVKPVRTNIVNVGGKATAQAGVNNRFVVFGQAARNRQPYRLGGFLRPAPIVNVNDSEDSTTSGDAQGGVWKVEWNSTARPKLHFELLAGQFIAGRHERPNGTSPRFEDTTASLPVSGRNRDWAESRRIDQVAGSVIGGAMRHYFKLGGSVERVLFRERWYRGYPDDVLHVRANSSPAEVYLFQTPSKSEGGLQWYSAYVNDSWRATGRLTINLGLRFDRYRAFLPAQEHPAGQSGNRSWTRQVFAANDNLIDWNVVAPRVGVSHDLTGAGRTVLKATYGRYWLPPGPDLLFNANPNSRAWYERWEWKDSDNPGFWDPGEETRLIERRGGKEVESLDDGLKLDFMHEVTARLEREIAANTRVATSAIWRGHRQPFLRQDASYSFSAFSRAVPVPDPGVDGQPGTADDGPAIVVHDLPGARVSPSYRVANVPNAPSDHVTWEVTADRRLSGRWSLVAGLSHTWTRDQASGYSGQAVRANPFPLTPNDLINTDGKGRHEFRVWSARASGTWEGPWGLRITPFLRHQSGQPYGRTFLINRPGFLNLGPLRVLAEPIGTRRMDNITLVDLRVEKAFPVDKDRKISMFFDVFNLLNANPELTVTWSSGSTFGNPIAIVPPRIARVGMKVAW